MLDAPLRKASSIAAATSVLVLPPRRILPSEAAAADLRTEKGAWDPNLAPMMLEPLNMLASREYQGIVFVGSARTSKTMSLVLGAITYVVQCAPGDILVMLMSQDSARDFSKMDLDRAIRHSPALGALMSPRASDDNVYDKFFRNGIVLKIGWPAITQLSQKTLRYVLLTDYDRPKNRDNVDGEGPLWELAIKRIDTMMSRGKCLAESSPEAEYLDNNWKPNHPHDAPPCSGILDLYNRGTRARWYWPCPHCGDPFQALPGLGNFQSLPPLKDLEDLVLKEDSLTLAMQHAKIVCPQGCIIEQEKRTGMSEHGTWVHAGQAVDGNMRVTGERRPSRIASYWLGGVAAAFQRWDTMLMKYFDALRTYKTTGLEEALKGTVNMDQGAAYLPRVASAKRNAEELRMRLEEWPRGRIPAGVRFLTAQVDVQASKFQVHVMGWGQGLESWLIERFAIRTSTRMDGERNAALEPGSYLEDWLQLVPMVMEKTYETVAGGVFAKPVVTMCDSGGKDGVTGMAYAFWRHLKRERDEGGAPTRRHLRLWLTKGSSSKTANVATRTYPDSTDRKDRTQGGRGDVPVWMLNVHMLKDAVAGELSRDDVGPGYCHLPKWLEREEPEYFSEIVAESRDRDKGWQNLARAPNEAWDLHVMGRAAVRILRADRINWAAPPRWALGLESNAALDLSPVIESDGEPGAQVESAAPPPAPAPVPAPAQKATVADKMKAPGWSGKGGWLKPGGWRK